MASRTVEIFKELSYLFAELAEETEREEWIREDEDEDEDEGE